MGTRVRTSLWNMRNFNRLVCFVYELRESLFGFTPHETSSERGTSSWRETRECKWDAAVRSINVIRYREVASRNSVEKQYRRTASRSITENRYREAELKSDRAVYRWASYETAKTRRRTGRPIWADGVEVRAGFTPVNRKACTTKISFSAKRGVYNCRPSACEEQNQFGCLRFEASHFDGPIQWERVTFRTCKLVIVCHLILHIIGVLSGARRYLVGASSEPHRNLICTIKYSQLN